MVIGVGVIRLQLDGLPVAGDGLVEVLLMVVEDTADMKPAPGNIGTEGHRRAKIAQRFVPMSRPQLVQAYPQGDVGPKVGRVQLLRLTQYRDPLPSLFRLERQTRADQEQRARRLAGNVGRS